MNQSLQSTYNYLVPADGTTHEVSFSGILVSGQDYDIDWHSFIQNNFPFRPQGAKIQNPSSAPVVLANPSTGETSTCPPESSRWVSFTSTAHMKQTLSGAGNVTVIFVDYPVIETAPVSSDGTPIAPSLGDTVTITGSIPAGTNTIGNVGIAGSIPAGTNLMGFVDISAELPAGSNTIGNVGIAPGALTSQSASTSASGSTTLWTPKAGQSLRQAVINVPNAATLAANGELTLTLSQGANIIAEMGLYLATIPGALTQHYTFDFGSNGFLSASGNPVTLELSSALATGAIYVNGYYTG